MQIPILAITPFLWSRNFSTLPTIVHVGGVSLKEIWYSVSSKWYTYSQKEQIDSPNGETIYPKERTFSKDESYKVVTCTTTRDEETVAVAWLDVGLWSVDESSLWLYKHLRSKTYTDVEDKIGAWSDVTGDVSKRR